MKMIPQGSIRQCLEALAGEARVYAPVKEDGLIVITQWKGQDLAQGYINPENTLKDVLYPQTDTLLEFAGGYEDLTLKEPKPVSPQVVFGTRPCDAAALEMNAQVFLGGEFTDENFRRRRDATVVMSLACKEAGPYCFCRAMGGSPAGERGSDVMFYPRDGAYYVQALTGRGERVLAGLGGLMEEAPAGQGEDARAHCQETPVPRAEGLPVEGLQHRTEPLFDHPYWEELSHRCHSCGICTFVCPTCYCFAVFDAPRGTRGKRMRGWDACQFKDFLLMAGGHNPRPTKKERVRQRFMHKLNYFVDTYGEYQCAGCGRCVIKCPVGLHILGVITGLEGVVS
jgi:ferredoxin